MQHGRHWPREEQNANAREGFGGLYGDPASAARVAAAWVAVFPPFTSDDYDEEPAHLSTGAHRG